MSNTKWASLGARLKLTLGLYHEPIGISVGSYTHGLLALAPDVILLRLSPEVACFARADRDRFASE